MTIPILSGPYKTFHRLKQHESYLEFEGSTITIPIKARMTEHSDWMTDEVVLRAFMRLEVFPAYVNGLGTREIQFIIRDWELFGTCPLLNKLFWGHPLGCAYDLKGAGKDARCAGERLPAVLTFTVSHNFEKDGDPNDHCLGPVHTLDIRNLTSHDLRAPEEGGDGLLSYGVPGNSIYWELREDAPAKQGQKGATGAMLFFKRPPGQTDRVPGIDPVRDHDCILARAEGISLAPNQEFTAALDVDGYRRNSNVTKAKGNCVISPLQKPRSPVEIRWRLGRDPRPGSGRIRLVSPARSLCTADQRPGVGHPTDSADFPARITYAINYHIHINRERFVEDQAGIAIAVGATEIPPRDVTVAFDKPHVGTVLGRYLEFGPGHCTGMHTITEDEYLLGARTCRYWRTVPLEVSRGWPAPFDPDFAY